MQCVSTPASPPDRQTDSDIDSAIANNDWMRIAPLPESVVYGPRRKAIVSGLATPFGNTVPGLR